MADFVDVGGGYKQYIGSQPHQQPDKNPLDQVQQILSLKDLSNRIAQAPVDMRIKELDQALRTNQVLQTGVENERAAIALKSAKNTESRAQADFFRNGISSLPAIANMSPELAKGYAAKFGIDLAENKETGGFNAAIQMPNGEVKVFPIDTTAVTDPEKIKGIENTYRDEWGKASLTYRVQYQQFGAMKKALALATPQGDISGMFAYMKLNDPNSSVREGEIATAQNSPGVSEWIRNQYNRALTSKSPLFGPANSITRANFVDAGDALVREGKTNTEAQARFFLNMANNSKNVKASNVLTPAGDISLESLTHDSSTSNITASDNSDRPTKKTTEASSIGSAIPKPAPEARSQSTAPKKSLDDILSSQLFLSPGK